MFEFKLPDLGEGIHEAEILRWHVEPGDSVEEDQPLVDVETDKAAVTIPSPHAGVIISTTGGPGDVVVVGQVITVIEAPPAGSASVGRPPAAPATRRLARELGVDINLVRSTGPAGRVTPEDVHHAAQQSTQPDVGRSEQRASAHSAGHVETAVRQERGGSVIPFLELEPLPDFSAFGPIEREPIRSIRRKIARKMVTSMVVVPHVIHMDEADVTDLESFRRRFRERVTDDPSQITPSLLAFVVKAVTAGLRRIGPMFNASLDPDRSEIITKHYYNIGLAADTPKGLLVPVVKGAEGKSILEIAAEIRTHAERARTGTIELGDLQGGSFTITNIGPLGGIALAPAINYPEVAILGMGKVQEKPVVREGEIVVRKMLPLTLSFDHRVADGADAARFVSHVVRLLSDPDSLLVEV